ncbi:hypothetical protein [Cupriavidus necator]|jgi:hypothetical protein|nr:hypothetical protein [Cupriavidus necator]
MLPAKARTAAPVSSPAAVLALVLWPAVRWFVALKARRRDWAG